MPKHSETRPLPYTPEQMFDLVADVARYPEFLPWVSAIRVRSNSDSPMVADMIVGFKGLRETFTSKVE
ncbi:type II toxin-antitoxin system RatA family toxin, partial [Escherichia coli]|nr:type II toxin-antitoxin system RatA family toxin [Escherichia coli]